MNTDPGLVVIQFRLKKKGVPNKRAARVQIEITSTFSDRKCTPQLPHTTLLHAFRNHTIRSRLFFCVCVCVFCFVFFFVRAMFWEPKLQNLPNNGFLCISYYCNFIGYLKQASKSDWWLLLFLLFFGFLSHWLGNTNDLEQRILQFVN